MKLRKVVLNKPMKLEGSSQFELASTEFRAPDYEVELDDKSGLVRIAKGADVRWVHPASCFFMQELTTSPEVAAKADAPEFCGVPVPAHAVPMVPQLKEIYPERAGVVLGAAPKKEHWSTRAKREREAAKVAT